MKKVIFIMFLLMISINVYAYETLYVKHGYSPYYDCYGCSEILQKQITTEYDKREDRFPFIRHELPMTNEDFIWGVTENGTYFVSKHSPYYNYYRLHDPAYIELCEKQKNIRKRWEYDNNKMATKKDIEEYLALDDWYEQNRVINHEYDGETLKGTIVYELPDLIKSLFLLVVFILIVIVFFIPLILWHTCKHLFTSKYSDVRKAMNESEYISTIAMGVFNKYNKKHSK